jgi:hypothetical protein
MTIRYDLEITEDMYPMRTQPIIGFTDVAGRRWRRIGSVTPPECRRTTTSESATPPDTKASR